MTRRAWGMALWLTLVVMLILVDITRAPAEPTVWTAPPAGTPPEITLFIRTPLQILEAARAEGHRGHVVGLTQFRRTWSGGLHCTISVPPLTLFTMWIWNHEIRHCNEGDFHGTL